MKVPTIWIRNPKNGDRRKINLADWASDLGRGHYSGWTALSDAGFQGADPKADPPKQTVHKVKRSPGRPKKSAAQTLRESLVESTEIAYKIMDEALGDGEKEA